MEGSIPPKRSQELSEESRNSSKNDDRLPTSSTPLDLIYGSQQRASILPPVGDFLHGAGSFAPSRPAFQPVQPTHPYAPPTGQGNLPPRQLASASAFGPQASTLFLPRDEAQLNPQHGRRSRDLPPASYPPSRPILPVGYYYGEPSFGGIDPQEAQALAQDPNTHTTWTKTNCIIKCDCCKNRCQGLAQRCNTCNLNVCRPCTLSGRWRNAGGHYLNPAKLDWSSNPAPKSKAAKARTTSTRPHGEYATNKPLYYTRRAEDDGMRPALAPAAQTKRVFPDDSPTNKPPFKRMAPATATATSRGYGSISALQRGQGDVGYGANAGMLPSGRTSFPFSDSSSLQTPSPRRGTPHTPAAPSALVDGPITAAAGSNSARHAAALALFRMRDMDFTAPQQPSSDADDEDEGDDEEVYDLEAMLPHVDLASSPCPSPLPQAEPESESQSEFEAESESEVPSEFEAQSESEAQPEPETQPEPQPEAQPQVQPEPEPEPEPTIFADRETFQRLFPHHELPSIFFPSRSPLPAPRAPPAILVQPLQLSEPYAPSLRTPAARDWRNNITSHERVQLENDHECFRAVVAAWDTDAEILAARRSGPELRALRILWGAVLVYRVRNPMPYPHDGSVMRWFRHTRRQIERRARVVVPPPAAEQVVGGEDDGAGSVSEES